MNSTKTRQSNIELLRILTMLGVIILHYNNVGIGGGFRYVSTGSLNFYILYGLESLFVCAVNLFILISGFFLCTSYKRNWWKVVELIVQVIIFSEGIYVLQVICGKQALSVKTIVLHLIPANYFVILYVCVFILSPFINKLLNNLTKKQLKIFVILLLCMFSIEPTIVDIMSELKGSVFVGLSFVGMYGSQWGYSLVNFILMYIIGAYIRKNIDNIKSVSYGKLLACLGFCVIIMTVWSRINDRVGYLTEKTAWEYCNPLVIFAACLVFICFYKMDIKYNKVINKLAKASFTVYLLHNRILGVIGIQKFVNKNCFVMLLHIIVSIISIYLICWCVWWVYDKIMSLIYKKVEGVIHIPEINVE